MKTLFIYCLLALPLLCQAQSDAAQLRKGNEAYGKGEYDIAEQYYQRAAGGEYAPQAAFNTAAAQYQRQQYEQAAQLFEQTAQSLPPEQRANAHYNAGNALLKAGKLDESIAAYKNALRQNPNNADAKYNLAYAQKMKKQQQQNQDQQDQNQDQQDQNKEGQDQQQGKDGQDSQDQQQQNQDRQNQNKEGQDQQQQSKDGQNQQDQNKEGQDQQQQGEDGQNPQDQQQQGKEGQNPQDPNGEMMPNSQIKRLSKQEAARLLEAMRLEELKVQQRVKQKQAEGKATPRGGKDW